MSKREDIQGLQLRMSHMRECLGQLQRQIDCGASVGGHDFGLYDVSIQRERVRFRCDCGQVQIKDIENLTSSEKTALQTLGVDLGES